MTDSESDKSPEKTDAEFFNFCFDTLDSISTIFVAKFGGVKK